MERFPFHKLAKWFILLPSYICHRQYCEALPKLQSPMEHVDSKSYVRLVEKKHLAPQWTFGSAGALMNRPLIGLAKALELAARSLCSAGALELAA